MSIFKFFKKQESKKIVVSGTMDNASSKTNNEESTNKTMEVKKQEQTKENAENVKVFNLIILDQSGSMQSIYAPALSGVNETLQTIRLANEDHPEQDHYVTLVAFDGLPQEGLRYNLIYDSIPATEIKDISSSQYRPYGNTPLFDAMGKAINELRDKAKENDVVLVTVITDGYENASIEYSGVAIKSLVEEMRKKGWVFTYIGANQDVDKVADSMSINNRMAFQASYEGTKAMFAKERMSRGKFFEKVSHRNSMSKEDFEENFFED